MNKAKVYLCGGIAGLTRAEASGWRDLFKGRYGADHCLDPTRNTYEFHEPNFTGISDEEAKRIVKNDLADIHAADALVVYYVRPSVGTSMEVALANRMGKFIVTINASGSSTEYLSPWLRVHSHAIVSDIQSAVAKLNWLGDPRSHAWAQLIGIQTPLVQIPDDGAFNPLAHEQTR